jgi:hypothetical protein
MSRKILLDCENKMLGRIPEKKMAEWIFEHITKPGAS